MNDFFLQHPEVCNFLHQFEHFLQSHIHSLSQKSLRGHRQLWKSIHYTLFSQGKRFRPVLTFSTAKVCAIPIRIILPWAGAIEMMHTASLIHDDLPSMDNSLVRRNQASNHRLFGEDIALLAGNCLWIEAFRLITPHLQHLPSIQQGSPDWLSLLCTATGFHGLMGGQALDLRPEYVQEYYPTMHAMKTADLMAASMQGVLTLKKERDSNLYQISHTIGTAFQLADDLEDETEDRHSYVFRIGRKQIQNK